MQTQIKPASPLLRRVAELRAQITDTRIEIDATPDPRDADGCCLSDARGDLCDELDALETDLAEIEEHLDAETD